MDDPNQIPPAELQRSGTPSPISRGRSSRVPLVLGLGVLLAIVLGAATLLLYRYFTHDSGQTTIPGGVLTATPSGLYFRNTAENIAFVAPADWSKYPTSTAQIMVRGGGCSFGLLEQRTRLPVSAFADAEAKDLTRRHPEAIPIIAPRTVAGRTASPSPVPTPIPRAAPCPRPTS